MSKVDAKKKAPAKNVAAKKAASKPVKAEKEKNKEENKEQTPEERRLANLEKGKFQPGVSGNPNGRPPGKRNFETVFKAAVERYALEYLDQLNEGRKKQKLAPFATVEEARIDPEAEMVMKQIDKARAGDTRAFEALMKFQHPQKMQHSGDRENPLLVEERRIHVKAEVKRIFHEWGVAPA